MKTSIRQKCWRAKSLTGGLLLTAVMLMATGCQESLEERCQREAREYTKKHCPLRIDDYTVMDSMTFDKASHTIGYIYTLHGAADDSAAISKVQMHDLLLKEVRNSAHLKMYKEKGYSFRYTYYSAKTKGKRLLDTVLKAEDYR